MKKGRVKWRKYGKWVLGGYLLLLGASHLFIAKKGEDDRVGGEKGLEASQGWLGYQEWGQREGVPLILSHGSPGGGGADFEEFAMELSKERWVIAPDRWGFGRSEKRVKDYSFVADAQAMVELMDYLEIEEADVMGWSYGGGVVLEMAERFPERVRGVGLLGAIGIQEGEGSGNYWIEQTKYRALWLSAVALPELIPHFGLAGPRWFRNSFYRDFADADQRPLREIMERLAKPVLILHGEDDPLVMAWVAEEHHALLSRSRLEILEGSHFFPAGGEGMSSAVRSVESFLEEVSEEGVISGSRYEPQRKKMKALWVGGPELRGWKPWWLVMGLSAVLAWRWPRRTLFVVASGGGLLLWDAVIGVAAVLATLGGKKLFGRPLEKPRSRWFPLHLFFDLVAGSLVGGMLRSML